MISIAVLNLSRHPGLTRDLVGRMVLAIAKQCVEHVQPAWQILPPALSFEIGVQPPAHASPILIFDTPEQAGYYGYHSVTPQGMPYGRVFVDPILRNGGGLERGDSSVSVTLSHEVLEMIGDPHVNEWCDNDEDGYSYAEELCDPTQSQAYDIDGIAVSNFVTPAWFELRGRSDRIFDHLGLLTRAFQVPRGGYAIRRPGGGGEVENVWGAEVPPWVRELKGHRGSRTERRCIA